MRRPKVVALAVLLAAGCGGAADSGGDGRPDAQSAPPAQDRGECGRVTVPGHEAIDIRASGVACEFARSVAAAAEGRGRAPYEAGGFACQPADASAGDTNYTCTRGEANIRFLYGTS